MHAAGCWTAERRKPLAEGMYGPRAVRPIGAELYRGSRFQGAHGKPQHRKTQDAGLQQQQSKTKTDEAQVTEGERMNEGKTDAIPPERLEVYGAKTHGREGQSP